MVVDLFLVSGYGDTENRGDASNQMGDDLPFVDLGDDFDPIQGLRTLYRFQMSLCIDALFWTI